MLPRGLSTVNRLQLEQAPCRCQNNLERLGPAPPGFSKKTLSGAPPGAADRTDRNAPTTPSRRRGSRRLAFSRWPASTSRLVRSTGARVAPPKRQSRHARPAAAFAPTHFHVADGIRAASYGRSRRYTPMPIRTATCAGRRSPTAGATSATDAAFPPGRATPRSRAPAIHVRPEPHQTRRGPVFLPVST